MSNAFNLSQLANNINTSGQVSMTAGVTGTLPIANGGTNSTATPTNGGVAYGTGTANAYTAAGTSGYFLQSTGAATPTWAAVTVSAFPSGTRMSFQQSSAPTGWTKDTTSGINDAILRLVTGSVSSGGTTAFSTWNAQTASGATTLSTAQMPSHAHTADAGSGGTGSQLGNAGSAAENRAQCSTNSTGGGGSHTHSLTQSIKYYDFIIASAN
jgi:hypothetical protein